jgi:hypothetical protein
MLSDEGGVIAGERYGILTTTRSQMGHLSLTSHEGSDGEDYYTIYIIICGALADNRYLAADFLRAFPFVRFCC